MYTKGLPKTKTHDLVSWVLEIKMKDTCNFHPKKRKWEEVKTLMNPHLHLQAKKMDLYSKFQMMLHLFPCINHKSLDHRLRKYYSPLVQQL